MSNSREHRILRDLVQAAMRLHGRRLWEAFGNDDTIELRLPGHDKPWYATIMGAAGQEFGLHVLCGADDFPRWREDVASGDHEAAFATGEHLVLTVERLSNIPPERRGLLRKAGFAARAEALAPLIIAKEPGRPARHPDLGEAEDLLRLIRALLRADERGELRGEQASDRRPVLVVSGDVRDPAVEVRWEDQWPPIVGPLRVPRSARDLPRLEETWAVGVRAVRVQMPADGTSLDVQGVIVASLEREGIVHTQAVGEPALREAGLAVIRAFQDRQDEQEPGLPREIAFAGPGAHELLGILAEPLAELGIATRVAPHVALLDTSFGEMERDFRGEGDEALRSGGPRQLTNTDGEDLDLQEAVFRVTDPEAARKVIAARDDVELDEEADEFVWWKPTREDQATFGDRVTHARLRLLGDELLVNVTSAGRLRRAQEWIDRIPGVRFERVRPIPIEPRAERPLDDRINPPQPLELSPEMVEEMTARLREHYRRWCDIPVPALGGKTPRQACRTASGRSRVALMVRSLPSAMPGLDMAAISAEVLRELGLEGRA